MRPQKRLRPQFSRPPLSDVEVAGQTDHLTALEKQIYWRLRGLSAPIEKSVRNIFRGDFFAPGHALKIHFAFKKKPHSTWGHLKIYIDWIPKEAVSQTLDPRTFYVLPFHIEAGTRETYGQMNAQLCRAVKDTTRTILFRQSDLLVLLAQWAREPAPPSTDPNDQPERRSFYHIAGPL